MGDLKSTMNASKEMFRRDVYKYGYYLSAAFYIDVAKEVDIPIDEFVLLPCEKVPPFDFGLYRIVPRAVDHGRIEYLNLLTAYADCRETGKWGGYPREIVDIDIPDFAYGWGGGGVDIDLEDEDEEDEDDEEFKMEDRA